MAFKNKGHSCQPLDLMKTTSREQLSRDTGFVHSFCTPCPHRGQDL